MHDVPADGHRAGTAGHTPVGPIALSAPEPDECELHQSASFNSTRSTRHGESNPQVQFFVLHLPIIPLLTKTSDAPVFFL